MADTAQVIQYKKDFYRLYNIPKAYQVTWDKTPVIVDANYVNTHSYGGFAITVMTKGFGAYPPTDIIVYLSKYYMVSFLAHEFAHASYFTLSQAQQIAFVNEFNRLASEGVITDNDYRNGISDGLEPHSYYYTAHYANMPATLKQFYPYIFVPGPIAPTPTPVPVVAKIVYHNTSKLGGVSCSANLRVVASSNGGGIMDGTVLFAADQSQEFDFTVQPGSVTAEVFDPNGVSLDKETMTL